MAAPAGLAHVAPTALHEVCSAFDVFEAVPGGGRGASPVIASIMLHGNEPGGLYAVQDVLRAYHEGTFVPQRALWVHIGNVEAARLGLRVLAAQPDYNRIWNQGHAGALASLARLRALGPQVIFDLHNSSGNNPAFAGVNRVDAVTLGLAHAFSPHVVHISGPTGLFTEAVSELAPAVVFELGPPHSREGASRAAALIIERLSATDASLPTQDPASATVHRNNATLRIDPNASMGGAGEGTALRFAPDLEARNFTSCPPGTVLAHVRPEVQRAVRAENDAGASVFDQVLMFEGDALMTKTDCVPVMMTTDEAVIRRDCWGYLMRKERV